MAFPFSQTYFREAEFFYQARLFVLLIEKINPGGQMHFFKGDSKECHVIYFHYFCMHAFLKHILHYILLSNLFINTLEKKHNAFDFDYNYLIFLVCFKKICWKIINGIYSTQR